MRFGAFARGVALLAAAPLVLSACTTDDDGEDPQPTEQSADEADGESDEPPPPIGLQVAVVLPDPNSVDAAVLSQMAADVRRLDATRGAEIAAVRPIRPSSQPFVTDLAWELARRETDLVCVVGWNARSIALELAELHPHLSFCSAPLGMDSELPDNIWPLEVRSEELGHVVGMAAVEAADGGTIGLVLGAVTKSRSSFRDGVLAAIGDLEMVSTTVGEELDAAAAVEQVLDEGADVVVIDSVAGAADVLPQAAERAIVLSPDVLVRGAVGERTALTWRIHWDVILRAALEHLLAGPSASDSFGFAEGAFSVTVGEAGSASLGLRIDRTVAELSERDRNPLERREDAPVEESDGLPRPDDEDEDDDGDDGAEGDEASESDGDS